MHLEQRVVKHHGVPHQVLLEEETRKKPEQPQPAPERVLTQGMRDIKKLVRLTAEKKGEEITTMTAVLDGKLRRSLEVQMELVRSILKAEIPGHLLRWRKMTIKKDPALDLIQKRRKIKSDRKRKVERGVEVEEQGAEVGAEERKSFEDRGVNQEVEEDLTDQEVRREIIRDIKGPEVDLKGGQEAKDPEVNP